MWTSTNKAVGARWPITGRRRNPGLRWPTCAAGYGTTSLICPATTATTWRWSPTAWVLTPSRMVGAFGSRAKTVAGGACARIEVDMRSPVVPGEPLSPLQGHDLRAVDQLSEGYDLIERDGVQVLWAEVAIVDTPDR